MFTAQVNLLTLTRGPVRNSLTLKTGNIFKKFAYLARGLNREFHGSDMREYYADQNTGSHSLDGTGFERM